MTQLDLDLPLPIPLSLQSREFMSHVACALQRFHPTEASIDSGGKLTLKRGSGAESTYMLVLHGIQLSSAIGEDLFPEGENLEAYAEQLVKMFVPELGQRGKKRCPR